MTSRIRHARNVARGDARRRDEGGYVLYFVAGLLVVLLAMAGFGVDLGIWFAQAQDTQSAVDAAALAGDVYLPGNFAQAQSVAAQTLAKNGIVSGSGGMSVSYSQVSGNSRRLKVCATDNDVDTFFTGIVDADPTISKCATAEYILPVNMGSPLNIFDRPTAGAWAAINGYCSAAEDGDPYNSFYRGMWNAGTYSGCGVNASNNPTYDADAYVWGVQLDSVPTQSVTIELYDPSMRFSGTGIIDGQDGHGGGVTDFTTTFTLTDATLTPLDYSDDPVMSTLTVARNDATWGNLWRSYATIPAGSRAGRYRITVTTSTGIHSHGINAFGIRARQGATFARCSSDVTAVDYSATCPQVFAEESLGIWANVAASTATFHLAEVEPIHAGKRMHVRLFDPGEGGQTIEVLDPNGNPITFDYTTVDDWSPTRSATGTTSINVSGTVAALPYHHNTWTFNDRMIEITFDLPANYTAVYGSNTWWKLRYRFGTGSVGDRTTWGVSIEGDPVRLVNN